MVFGLIGGEFHFSNAQFSQLHSVTNSHCMYLQVPDNQALAIIAPLWPQHPWFSEVLQLLISALIHLLCFPKLLTQAKENSNIKISHFWHFALGCYQAIN